MRNRTANTIDHHALKPIVSIPARQGRAVGDDASRKSVDDDNSFDGDWSLVERDQRPAAAAVNDESGAKLKVRARFKEERTEVVSTADTIEHSEGTPQEGEGV